MRKATFLLLFLLLSTFLPAQVIEAPKFKVRTGNIYNITRIERNAEATRLHIHAIFRPHWWIKVGNDCYLEDAETHRRYAFTGAEGIDPNQETYMPDSGEMDFVLKFEPLPGTTRYIHLIDSATTVNNTFDISLIPAGKKGISPLDTIRGNWFDGETGSWILGIYDSIAIADNRIYTYEQVRKRGKRIELTLRDKQSGQLQTLSVAPQRDGSCQLTLNGAKRTLTRTRQHTEIMADRGYEHFFRSDTAIIQGYIDGYDRRLGFDSGLIYLKHLAAGTDIPTVVEITPDGTFTCRLPLQHPVELALLVDNEYIPFYLEPGETQTMYLSWEDVMARFRAQDHSLPLPQLQFMGDKAYLSYLSRTLLELPSFDYRNMMNYRMTLTPEQFKEHLQPTVQRWQQTADSLCAIYQPSQKAVKLIRNTTALNEGFVLFEFNMYRSQMRREHPDNEALRADLHDDYYDFLRRMPLDDPEMLVCSDADKFTNRFEFMDILWKIKREVVIADEVTDDEAENLYFRHEMAEQAALDSLVAALYGQEHPFLWQMAGVRRMKDDLNYFDSYAHRLEYFNRLRLNVGDSSFLAGELDRIFAEVQAEKQSKSYALPEGKATDILRNIVKDHPGKVLFIDFWATTCGPCRSGIESTAELRQKYKDHPEFKFIYITGAADSPRGAYDQYVEKHLKGEASYYLSATEFAYLRQLFKFNGIPHYELVEKDGTISTEHLSAGGLYYYLPRRFPLNEK